LWEQHSCAIKGNVEVADKSGSYKQADAILKFSIFHPHRPMT